MTETISRSRRVSVDLNLIRRLFGNYAFQLINQLISIGQQLILVPLFLRVWGVDVYGNWTVLCSVVAFVATCNFGLEYYFAAAFVRHATERRDDLMARQLKIAIFCAVAVSFTILTLFLAGIWALDVKTILNLKNIDSWSVYFILLSMAVPVLIVLPLQILRGLYRANGDFNRGEGAFALHSLAQLGFTVGMLLLQQPPWIVAISYLIVPFLYGACLLVDLGTRYPSLQLGLAIPTLSEIKAILPSTLLYFLDPLSALLILHGPLLLFGMMNVSAPAIVSYTVYRTFTGLARQSANQFAVGGGIEMARLLVREEKDACGRLYHNVGQAVACMMGVLVGVSIPASGPFISIWTHGAPIENELLLLFFFCGGLLAAPGQSALSMLRYAGHVRSCAVAWSVHSLMGLVIGVILVPRIGVAGVAAGFAISEFLAVNVYLPLYIQRRFGFSAIRHWFLSYSAGVGSFILSYAVARAVFNSHQIGPMELAVRSVAWAAIMTIPVLIVVTGLVRRASNRRSRNGESNVPQTTLSHGQRCERMEKGDATQQGATTITSEYTASITH